MQHPGHSAIRHQQAGENPVTLRGYCLNMNNGQDLLIPHQEQLKLIRLGLMPCEAVTLHYDLGANAILKLKKK